LRSEDTTFIKTIACSILQLGSKEVCLLGSVPNVAKKLVMDQSMWLLHKMHLASMDDLAST
jgi:hypothetical protein